MAPARDMTDLFSYVEQHLPQALDDLAQFCSQPSVSTQNRGMAEMVELLRGRLERSNFAVEVVPLDGGFPVVYAESLDEVGADAPVLAIYNHYDVQPEGDLDLWTAPPFVPEIRDGKMFARGVSDNKGNIVSRLAAVDALRAVLGRLPIKIKWVIEGEEEIGSPNIDRFVEAYRERLAADGCIWEFGFFDWDGTPLLTLGLKGMLLVELRCRGPRRDLHSSMAAFVGSPVWRLVWALSTLKDENEFVAVEGFYDRLRPPSETEVSMARALPVDDSALRQELGVEEFAAGLDGYQRRMAEIFSPTCNIQGLWAGYTGEGSKTILPAAATAKLDFRLVPDQDPAEILDLLRAHLAEKGFGDIEVVPIEGSLFPARTDPDHPFVRLARDAAVELMGGAEPIVSPSSPASGPMYSFTDVLGLPVVAIGVGYPASAQHAPDENIRLDDFARGTSLMALLMQRMAEAGTTLPRSVAARKVSDTAPHGGGSSPDDRPTGLPGAEATVVEADIDGMLGLDFAAIQAEMDGGIDESRALPATQRPEIEEALEDVERAQDIAEELLDEPTAPETSEAPSPEK